MIKRINANKRNTFSFFKIKNITPKKKLQENMEFFGRYIVRKEEP